MRHRPLVRTAATPVVVIAALSLAGCSTDGGELPADLWRRIDARRHPSSSDAPSSTTSQPRDPQRSDALVPFTGTYRSAFVAPDGTATLQIVDDCSDRAPAAQVAIAQRGATPPAYVVNLLFDRSPDGCPQGHVRELVVRLPEPLRSPAVIDFRSASGSCVQSLVGVAAFVPPHCD
jgi:hypothetical protein